MSNGLDTARVEYQLGLALEAYGVIPLALKHYRNAVTADPANADAQCSLGILLASTGELAGAVTALRASCALNAEVAQTALATLTEPCLSAAQRARTLCALARAPSNLAIVLEVRARERARAHAPEARASLKRASHPSRAPPARSCSATTRARSRRTAIRSRSTRRASTCGEASRICSRAQDAARTPTRRSA